MNYSIRSEGGTVVMECGAAFSYADAVESLTAIRDAPEYASASRVLVLDPGSTFNPTGDQTRVISGLFASMFEGRVRRVALVVAKRVHFGIGRMIAVFADPEVQRFRVFQVEDEARAWLAENAE